MAKKLDLNEALEYGIKFAQKNGAEQVEGYKSHARDIEISVEKSIPSISTGISQGLSFRVVAQNNLGFAFTKTITKERIEDTITIAIQNAKAKGKDPDFKSLPLPSKKKVPKFTYDKKLESLTADELADKISYLIDQINDVKGLHYLQGQLFLGLQNDRLLNSNGVDIQEKGGGIGGFAAAITTKGLIPNYSFCVKGARTSDTFSIDELLDETVKQTQRAAAPKTINFEKEVPIIFEPQASLGVMGGLFRILANQLAGDNVASGATPYSDQVGNEVAVEDFSFLDNGIDPNKITSSAYDAEGVPKENTTLIEKGILKTFLLNTYYGQKLGLESNGKSTRAGQFGFGGDPVKTIPQIGTNSLEILSGNSSYDEMIEETKEGFMVRSLMGLHMSDTSSGRFSVTGFGWYIKNGEIKYPVQGISLSGMLPKLIQNIDLISKERESMILSEAPYIRFSSMNATAKKFDFKTRFGLSVIKILTSLKIIKHPML